MTEHITKAVEILRQGGLVAFPTETVYGLGADAANESAIQKVFHAKGRPHDHPLIVHLAGMNQLNDWARDISPAAQKLMQAFWPGPLTLILKKQSRVLDLLTGGQDTIGLRIPNHPIAQHLLQAFGGGIAAPSANKFTHISPTTAEDVQEELGRKVDLILDGGVCEVGLESTIIDMSGDTPLVLRPGMITAEMMAEVLGVPVSSRQETTVRAPGMHHLHYAPTTKTTLVESNTMAKFLQTLSSDELPVVVVSRHDPILPTLEKIHWVKMPADAVHYAHDLYQTLRALDHQQFKQILIEKIPHEPEWVAIQDRLEKASGR